MIFPNKVVLFGVSVLIVIGFTASQAKAAGVTFDVLATETAIAAGPEMPFFPRILTNLKGHTSSAADPQNFCFDSVPESTFNPGEMVFLNLFWDDTVESDQHNEYDITHAISLAGKPRILGSNRAVFDTTNFPPGTARTFCLALQVQIPLSAPTITVAWGGRVIKIQDDTRVQGAVNNLTIGQDTLAREYQGTETTTIRILHPLTGVIITEDRFVKPVRVFTGPPAEAGGIVEANPLNLAMNPDPPLTQEGQLSILSAVGSDLLLQYWTLALTGNNLMGSRRTAHPFFRRTSSSGADQGKGLINISAGSSTRGPMPLGQK